jgi:hypothetical protein
MKRKFRKLWRKFAKKPVKGYAKIYVEQLGLGAKDPTKANKCARKSEVANRIRMQVILPLKTKMLSNDADTKTEDGIP